MNGELDYIIIYKGEALWGERNHEEICNSMLIGYNFYLIEEEPEEIDIESIEELDIKDNYNSYNKDLKINELIKVVKYLGRKINNKE